MDNQANYPVESKESRVARVTFTVSTFMGFLVRKDALKSGLDIKDITMEFVNEFVKDIKKEDHEPL